MNAIKPLFALLELIKPLLAFPFLIRITLLSSWSVAFTFFFDICSHSLILRLSTSFDYFRLRRVNWASQDGRIQSGKRFALFILQLQGQKNLIFSHELFVD